jgi:acyl-CoA thioesterase-2
VDRMQEMLEALELDQVEPGLFRAQHVEAGRGVVFGGEMLGQAIVAAHRTQPHKRVRAIHTVFARGVSADRPADIQVELMHGGRNLGSLTVSFVQDERLCARALILMDVEEPDLIRHARPMPVVPKPDPAQAAPHALAGPETIVVGNVDLNDQALTGLPELQLWTRYPGAPDLPDINRALLAYATDGWLIGTAMRPHAGFGIDMAHVDISTGVVSHSLSFTEKFRADEWLLIDHQAVHAGNGRIHGQADVFTEDGRLVASFSQDALVRAWPEGQSPVGRESTAF